MLDSKHMVRIIPAQCTKKYISVQYSRKYILVECTKKNNHTVHKEIHTSTLHYEKPGFFLYHEFDNRDSDFSPNLIS